MPCTCFVPETRNVAIFPSVARHPRERGIGIARGTGFYGALGLRFDVRLRRRNSTHVQRFIQPFTRSLLPRRKVLEQLPDGLVDILLSLLGARLDIDVFARHASPHNGVGLGLNDIHGERPDQDLLRPRYP